MFTNIYKKILNIFVFLTVGAFSLNTVFAAIQGPPSGGQAPFTTMKGLIDTVFVLARWFEVIIILFAVIFILIGAFMYVSGGGDESQRKKAKDYLLYGVVGIIVAATAEGIVRAVASIFHITL